MIRAKAVHVAAVVCLLSGCATPALYEWGGYDELMYRQYKEPATALEVRADLEAHVRSVESDGQRVAPGLYAEVGTLYLQSGDIDKALTMYQRERAFWPESKPLMDAMIANLERRNEPERKSQ